MLPARLIRKQHIDKTLALQFASTGRQGAPAAEGVQGVSPLADS